MLFPDEIIMLSDNFGKHQKEKGVLDDEENQVNVMAYLSSNEIYSVLLVCLEYFVKVKK